MDSTNKYEVRGRTNIEVYFWARWTCTVWLYWNILWSDVGNSICRTYVIIMPAYAWFLYVVDVDFFIYPWHLFVAQYKSVAQIDLKFSTGHLQSNKVLKMIHKNLFWCWKNAVCKVLTNFFHLECGKKDVCKTHLFFIITYVLQMTEKNVSMIFHLYQLFVGIGRNFPKFR